MLAGTANRSGGEARVKRAQALPRISRPLARLFGRYGSWYLARNFHSLRILQSGARPPNDFAGPLVVYLNHAAWWDPLVCLFLAREFLPGRSVYGPIAAAALERYRFFKRLGFYPVEIGTARGAAQFLHMSEAILARPESAIFLTPQGKFADVRVPLVFAPGLELLAARVPEARFVPLAIEYTFWEERKAEVLIGFGEAGGGDLTQRMTETQATLAGAAQRRQPNDWKVLLRSRSGVSRPYDLWRGLRARLRGERFDLGHSDL